MRLLNRFLVLTLSAGLLSICGAVQAAESFTVSGPLTIYRDYTSNTYAEDYTYAAKFTYDSSTPLSYTITPYFNYDGVSVFEDSIIKIEYKIYDSLGALVTSTTLTDIPNEVDVYDGSDDITFWGMISAVASAYVYFIDNLGQMVTSLTEFPTEPVDGDFQSSRFAFSDNLQRDPDDPQGDFISGYAGAGPVAVIANYDPIGDCITGAKNHGQFVSCVAKVTNELRKAGIITSEEKSELRSEAAHLKP